MNAMKMKWIAVLWLAFAWTALGAYEYVWVDTNTGTYEPAKVEADQHNNVQAVTGRFTYLYVNGVQIGGTSTGGAVVVDSDSPISGLTPAVTNISGYREVNSSLMSGVGFWYSFTWADAGFVTDETGGRNSGVLLPTNRPTVWSDYAMGFSKAREDYVGQAGSSSLLDLGVNALMGFWIRLTSPLSGSNPLLLAGGPTNYFGIYADATNIMIKFQLAGVSHILTKAHTNQLHDGQWHRVVAAYRKLGLTGTTGAQMCVWIDGVGAVSNMACTNAFLSNNHRFLIGHSDVFSDNKYLDGALDDVFVLNSWPTEAAITNDYAIGRSMGRYEFAKGAPVAPTLLYPPNEGSVSSGTISRLTWLPSSLNTTYTLKIWEELFPVHNFKGFAVSEVEEHIYMVSSPGRLEVSRDWGDSWEGIGGTNSYTAVATTTNSDPQFSGDIAVAATARGASPNIWFRSGGFQDLRTVHTNSNYQWSDVALSTKGTAVVILAVAANAPIRKSENGGATWTSVGLTQQWSCVAMGTNYRHAIVGSSTGGVYGTKDAGVTWSNMESIGVSDVCFARHQVGSEWRAYACETNGLIYYAYNLANGFKPCTYSPTGIWSSISCSDDGIYVVAAKSNGSIHVSYNAGTNWTDASGEALGNPGTVENIQRVGMSPDGSYLVAGKDDGQLYTSGNYGGTWYGWSGTNVVVTTNSNYALDVGDDINRTNYWAVQASNTYGMSYSATNTFVISDAGFTYGLYTNFGLYCNMESNTDPVVYDRTDRMGRDNLFLVAQTVGGYSDRAVWLNTGDADYMNWREYLASGTNYGNAGSGSFSVGMWFNCDANLDAPVQVLVRDSDDVNPSAFGFQIRILPGSGLVAAQVGVWDHIAEEGPGSIRIMGYANNRYPAREWSHVVAVVELTAGGKRLTLKIYLNGVLTHLPGSMASETTSYFTLLTQWPLNFGKTDPLYTSGWMFQGGLDDIFIVDRALSELEVLELYNKNRSRAQQYDP